MRPDGTGLTQVTQNGGFAAYESVTGDTLFYTKRSAHGLWMRPTDGGPETRVLDDLALPDWGNWAVTGDGLYFVRRGEGGTTIAFHDFATRASRTVASIPNIASPSLEVSPDGQRLLYARIEQSNSDLIATTLR
jgi:Tol biopolymer transport system component